jgi:hypothetical protein
MHLFKPVRMILPAAMSDIGGRIYHRLFTAAALTSSHETVYTDHHMWGEGGDGNLPSSHYGGPL